MQRLLAFGVWIFVSSYCFAETFEDFSYTTNEVGVRVTGYSGTATTVSIPSEINGASVKIIGAQSFWYNTNISKVILPNSITKIEAQAFQGCTSLSEINLPEGMTHLGTPETGGAVFYDCTSLTNIVLPKSLTYLHGSMFQGTQIESITIPSQVQFVGPYAFHFAQKLQEVKFQGPKPVFGNDWLFHINPSNVVCKYVSGLSGWSALGAYINSEGQSLVPLQPYAARLFIQTNSLGSVTATPQPNLENGLFYEIGTEVTLTAIPSNYASFLQWNGDLSGTNNPSVITLNSSKEIISKFIVLDSDNDGVFDFKEMQEGTDPNNPEDYKNLSKDLIAYYPFNGNSYDESGHENHGVISGGVFQTNNQAGIPNRAYFFDGSGIIQIAHNSELSLSPSNSLTISFWAKKMGESSPIHFIGKRNGHPYNFQMALDPYLGLLFGSSYGDGGFLGYKTGPTLPSGWNQQGVWIHLIGTYSENTWKMYQDGILLGTDTASVAPDDGSDLAIGGSGIWARFTGVIDEVRIYKRCLSESEALQLYAFDLGNLNWESMDRNLDGISDNRALSMGFSPLFNFKPILDSLKTNPTAGLFNSNHIQESRLTGRSDVTNNPNAYNLYTTSQIHNLGLGGIVLDRDTNNQLNLNYQVLQSSDLQNWTPYQSVTLPITNAPSDKMFLRVQAVGQ